MKTGAVEGERRGSVKTDAFRGGAHNIIKVKSVPRYPKKYGRLLSGNTSPVRSVCEFESGVRENVQGGKKKMLFFGAILVCVLSNVTLKGVAVLRLPL